LPLLLDDRDRQDDDELDADRRRPVGHGAPSDLKLLPDDELDDAPGRRPEPLPLLPSRSLLRNTGSGKHLLAAAVSSSSGPGPYDDAGATRGAMSRKAVGRCGARRRDGDTDAERAA
jgi:hypothetical protein